MLMRAGLAALTLAGLATAAEAQSNTATGALIGGATGAILGAQSERPPQPIYTWGHTPGAKTAGAIRRIPTGRWRGSSAPPARNRDC